MSPRKRIFREDILMAAVYLVQQEEVIRPFRSGVRRRRHGPVAAKQSFREPVFFQLYGGMTPMEYIPEIIEVIIPVLTAACGLAVGRLNAMKKHDAEKDAAHEAEMKAIKDGVKGLLRKEIINTGMHCIGKSFIPPYGIETLKGCYAPYVKLGDGDPAVAHIMNKCEALEIRSGSV